MNKPRSINIFLPEGDPNGIRVAEIRMSTIQAIAFRRNQFEKVRKTRPEIMRPGVYILLGHGEKNAEKWKAYIGESESVGKRLSTHNKNQKDSDWSETIILISKDENLTKSHARYIEARLVTEAANNWRWNLANTQQASEQGKLPRPDRAAMEEFVDQAITLTGTLGCDLFRKMRDTLPDDTLPEKTNEAPYESIDSPQPICSYKGKGFSAKMTVNATTGECVVRQGSQARKREIANIAHKPALLRKTLIEKGILREDNGALVFSRDYTFSSVITAALVVGGGSGNSYSWRMPDGHFYKNWKDSGA